MESKEQTLLSPEPPDEALPPEEHITFLSIFKFSTFH